MDTNTAKFARCPAAIYDYHDDHFCEACAEIQADAKTFPLVTEVPYRLEPFGQTGWSVKTFSNSIAAATWVRANPQAAMPCWQRFLILPCGELVVRK